MMASGPAGESEVLSLLKVISDPNGAKERLDQLANKAQLLAEQEEKFNQNAAETTGRLVAAQTRADADQAKATANLAQANKLLASNEARARELDRKAADIQTLAESLAAKEAGLVDYEKTSRAALDAREKDLSASAAALVPALESARAEADAAAKLKQELEDKLAQLRAIAS